MLDNLFKDKEDYFKKLDIGECMDLNLEIPEDVIDFPNSVSVCRTSENIVKAKMNTKQGGVLIASFTKRKMKDDEFKDIKKIKDIGQLLK